MGWGEEHKPANGGSGTTGQIELAQEALDRMGVPAGPPALRVLHLVGRHVHCDFDPIECSHQALQGEYEAVRERADDLFERLRRGEFVALPGASTDAEEVA